MESTATSLQNNAPTREVVEETVSKTAKPLQPSREVDAANYIADMILELRNLAKASGHKTLLELLEISYYEAFNRAHQIEVPSGEEQFLHLLGADARKAAAAAR